MTDQFQKTNINNPRIVRIEDADYNVTLDDSLIAASAATAAITLTLPPVPVIPGWTIHVKAESVAGGNITIAGQAGQLIDGAATYVISNALDAVIIQSRGGAWVIMASYSAGAGANCLGTYLVAPSADFAPYTSIQAAYNDASQAIAGTTQTAKVLVCPGTYTEDLTINRPGVSIVAVSPNRAPFGIAESDRLTYGSTRLQGRVSVNINTNARAGADNFFSMQGIDIFTNPTTPLLPLFSTGGNTTQVASLSDCLLLSANSSNTTEGIINALNLAGGPRSEMNLTRVNVQSALAPGVSQLCLFNDGLEEIKADDCVFEAQGWGDGDMGFALSITSGITGCVFHDCRMQGRLSFNGSNVEVRNCVILNTLIFIGASGQLTFIGNEVSRILAGDWITGTGDLIFDTISWRIESQSVSTIAAGVGIDQRSILGGAQIYWAPPSAASITIRGQTNVIVDDTVGAVAVNLPRANEFHGPIRIKDLGLGGPVTVVPTAFDQINGGGAGTPFALPAGGVTLISNGLTDWQTFG